MAGLALAVSSAGVARATRAHVLTAQGVAGVRFGLPKAEAVAELRAVLGRPSRSFVNTACGPRFREVSWGHVYVEFRHGTFVGFRYIENGWPPVRAGRPAGRSDRPTLATSRGVKLGGTLHELRAAYGRLAHIGTDRWRSPDGLVFYDDARRDPEPETSRIIEIEFGTCGDF